MIKLSSLYIACISYIIVKSSGKDSIIVNGFDLNMSTSSKQTRRQALLHGAASLNGLIVTPMNSLAQVSEQGQTLDLEAFKGARRSSATFTNTNNNPTMDPPPLLSIRGGIRGTSTIKIPRVGYSFYKTAPDQAARCTALALRAGIRHLDVGTLYGSNSEIRIPLEKYLNFGLDSMDYSKEKPELLTALDETRIAGEKHALVTASSGLLSPANVIPLGVAGRRGRREGLFISHKLSNLEQSTRHVDVRRAVKAQIATLGTQYLDMVSIHSPLTNKSTRLETYAALLELRDAGFVKSVGVANYGLGPLTEIKDSGLDLPSVNQLELSPFNTHSDIVSWCKENGITVACSAWSKLSSADGPQDQWYILADIAKKKEMTKAQVLVRWSLQKGYICVPRSASTSKIERIAIAEYSYGGVNPGGKSFILSKEEMQIIDGLNLNWKAGKLGRRDGWSDEDVTGNDWDPTDFL
jgi:diketogulonate reductase-like aldo/keto reductase